ncbi:hypothetical protein K1719_030181 [Acacia pycnantha]|nr:hypothetical protein K1719_030181 [Acacia pycnantha]
MEDLPEELKEEILLRLPVQSLLCLKCVSKSWRSRISNPNFAKLHVQLSNYSRHPNRILLTTSPQLRSIDINSLSLHDDSSSLDFDFPHLKPHYDVQIMGSCRGIVLLQIKDKHSYMWNPVTGDYKHISFPHQCIYANPFAFCYHEPTDDYFIGLSSYPLPDWLETFEVLSLRTNSWERLDLNNHSRIPHPNLGTLFNGAIHFLAYTSGSHLFPDIIAFDVTTKDLRQVSPIREQMLLCAELGVHEGCLALTGSTPDEIQVWVMRQYGVTSSWTTLISVSCYHSDISHFMLPLAFFKQGDEFIATYYIAKDSRRQSEGLAKLNYKGELLELRTYAPDLRKRSQPANWMLSHPRRWRHAIAYTETLLPLP